MRFLRIPSPLAGEGTKSAINATPYEPPRTPPGAHEPGRPVPAVAAPAAGCYNQSVTGPVPAGVKRMSDGDAFSDFIRRVRAGDEQAAADLVRRFEPLIRREVRLRLEDRRLGRLFDSMDVCQSVLASFFVRTAAGQYDLDQPGQLVKLLVQMARNKLASAARRQG